MKGIIIWLTFTTTVSSHAGFHGTRIDRALPALIASNPEAEVLDQSRLARTCLEPHFTARISPVTL